MYSWDPENMFFYFVWVFRYVDLFSYKNRNYKNYLPNQKKILHSGWIVQ